MAVPTITNITPDEGRPFGNYQVVITGTNFRLPDSVEDSEEWQESVRVIVNGNTVPNSKTRVRLSTEVEIQIPASTELPSEYPLLIDIQLLNIDASGTPIVGETVTLTDAFTYSSYDLEPDSANILEQIDALLQDYLARNLGIEVYFDTHVDFKNEDLTPFPLKTVQPALYLTGADDIKNALTEVTVRNTIEYTTNGRLRNCGATDRRYKLICVADKKRKLGFLKRGLNQAMFNIPNFEVDIYGTTVEIESFLDLDMPFNGIVQSFSSLQQFSGVITLQGVPRESDIIHNLYAVTEVIVTLPEGA